MGATPDTFYVPGWMRCRAGPVLRPNPTADELAAFEDSRRKHAAEGLAECRSKAKYLNVIPLWGQAAYAAAYAACDAIDWYSSPDDVFGAINQTENQIIARELSRGAPKAPVPPIIEPTQAQLAAYANARPKYEQAYARWKVDDVDAAIPTLSPVAFAALSPEQKQARARDVAGLTVMADQLCKPSWLKSVLLAKVQECGSQLAGNVPAQNGGAVRGALVILVRNGRPISFAAPATDATPLQTWPQSYSAMGYTAGAVILMGDGGEVGRRVWGA